MRRAAAVRVWVGVVLVGVLGACASEPAVDGPVGNDAGVQPGAADAAPIEGTRVFVPGPWTREYRVRKADSDRSLEDERRIASELGSDGRWTVRFERTPTGRTDWRLERTLTMTRTEEGVAMVKLDDATRGVAFEFEPPLVLSPGVVAGRSEAKARTTQGGESGEAIATIEVLGAVDGMERVRTTLTLVQGRTRIERVSELTLGKRGSVRERNERAVRWAGFRVDHADEVLEEVGQ